MSTKLNAVFPTRRALVTVTRLFIVATFFLCAGIPSQAQSVNATLSGTTTDQTGALLPGVTIRITNPETGFQREVQTGDNGSFTFPALPPATYTVSASRDGFAPAEFNNLKLNVNDDRSLRVELRVGEVGESVTVTDEPSLVDESPAQATVIDRQFVENLPLNGRSFQSLLLLSPGVVIVQSNANSTPGQFSVNGQRTNANYFTVDGVGANTATNLGRSDNATGIVGQTLAGTLPGFSALGTTSTLAPVDAVEEFKIQTSTYSAQFGRQPGGQVQIVTRSGASDFHGSIYDYVRNDKFDANNFFNNANGIERQPLRQNQFGGTFSGPVILPNFGEGGPLLDKSKRTFFFFAYEGLRLRLPNSINTLVPSLRLRQVANPALRAVLNAFPLPTGPEELVTNIFGERVPGGARFIGSYSDPKSSDTYSLRIDHNINDKLQVFGRYSDTPSQDALRSLSIINSRRVTARSLTLGTTFVPNSNFTNELNFNYSQNRGRLNQSIDDFGGAVPIDPSVLYSGYSGPGPKFGQFSLFFLGGTQIGLGDGQDSFQRQINVVDNASFIKGNHQFRFGVDYRRLMPTFAPYAFAQSSIIFLGESAFAASILGADEITSGKPLSLTLVSNQGAEPRFNNYSFYGEDTWKANKRLTLNLGLRYEINPAPYDANGREPIVVRGIDGTDVSGAIVAPAGTPFYKTFYGALAPRLGASYNLNDKPGRETILRGGFGVFYDLNGSQALNGFSAYPFQNSFMFPTQQPFNLPPDLAVPPPVPTIGLPITNNVNATDPDLKLPYTLQWNFGVERSLGKDQVVSVSYVASAGRRLTTTLALNRQVGGSITGGGTFPNPNFRNIAFTTNGPTSDYKSLQAQFQRRLSRGLQALANYTFAHATDVVSDEVTPGEFERGNASFDVRHNFSAALTYELPRFTENRFVNAVAHGWAIDSTIYLQSGQPINILAGSRTLADGTTVNVRPDRVEGVPVWIEQANVPGGRRINPAAFALPPRDAARNFTRQGTLGRNEIYGPGIFQVNTGVRREFGIYERLRLQLRAEAFNLFNRPQFSGYQTSLGFANFGIPTSTLNNSLGGGGVGSGGLNQLYQLGGPRSLQFSARFFF